MIVGRSEETDVLSGAPQMQACAQFSASVISFNLHINAVKDRVFITTSQMTRKKVRLREAK